MHVLIGAFGTRGDVQPMVALAQGLRRRSHTATLVVPPPLVDFARTAACDVVGAGLDYVDLCRRMSHGSFRDRLPMFPLMRSQVAAQIDAMEPFVTRADVIIGMPAITVGPILAAHARKPFAFFTFCPQYLPSSSHPSPLMLRSQTLPGWINRLSWAHNEWVWTTALRKEMNRARESRGLSLIQQVWSTSIGDAPVLACDPALATAPSDVGVPVTQIGPLFLEQTTELSTAVRAFLEAGPAPVYIGFGSMPDPHPRQTAARLVEAVQRAGVRALIARGAADLYVDTLPPDVMLVDAEPHARLLPRCAAIVHHGGAGTTHAAARAAVPQIILPRLFDQHFWAARIRALGVAPPVVGHPAVDPAPLAHALQACVTDEVMRARARALAATMRDDGVDRAIDWLAHVVDGADQGRAGAATRVDRPSA